MENVALFFMFLCFATYMIQEGRIVRIKSSRDRARIWRDFHAEWSARWETQAKSESLEVERLLTREIKDEQK